MTFEVETQIKANHELFCDYAFDLKNLVVWLEYAKNFNFITIYQEKIGSTMNIEIDLFNKNENFYFKLSEFEENKKLKLKAKNPIRFELTIKVKKATENKTCVALQTNLKSTNLLLFAKRKKMISSTKISLKNLESIFNT